MDALHFSNEAIAGLILQGLLMMLLPVVLLIVWYRKTHENLIPMLIGAAVWFVFAILLKLAPAYLLLQADNPVAKAIGGNIWLTMLVSGVLAGVFEETGRFIAFRFVLKKYDRRRSAITYGIGHGGFESGYVGFQILAIAALGILINSGMGEALTRGAEEAEIAALVAQLGPRTELTVAECLLGVFERVPAIVVHVSFSVLVFAAVRQKRFRYLFPAAIVLHTLLDFSTVFYQAGTVPLWGMEIILAVFAAAVAFLASRIYRSPD